MRLRILATSQAPLGIRGERVVHLQPLDALSPDGVTFEEVAASAAVALYCEGARAADDRFVLDAANVDAVANLCSELEGLPLAIELAAARSPTLPPAELLTRVREDRLGVLRRPGAPPAGARARHQDLDASIAWTWDLLTSVDQDLLGRLAVLAGDFSSADAEELAGDMAGRAVLDTLGRLVTFHLVDRVRDRDPARFRVPASIGEFVRLRLVRAGSLEEIERARVAWLASRERRAAGALDSDDEPEEHWREAIAERHADMLEAIAMCHGSGDAERAPDLLAAFASYWYHAGWSDGKMRLVDTTLALGRSRRALEYLSGAPARRCPIRPHGCHRARRGLRRARARRRATWRWQPRVAADQVDHPAIASRRSRQDREPSAEAARDVGLLLCSRPR